MYKLVKGLSQYKNCSRIHPLQQKKVAELREGLMKGRYSRNIRDILIFGSSVTDRCHVGSDVDIFVVLDDGVEEEYPRLVDRAYNFSYDMWTNKMVDSRLSEEIYRTGVSVYDE